MEYDLVRGQGKLGGVRLLWSLECSEWRLPRAKCNVCRTCTPWTSAQRLVAAVAPARQRSKVALPLSAAEARGPTAPHRADDVSFLEECWHLLDQPSERTKG